MRRVLALSMLCASLAGCNGSILELLDGSGPPDGGPGPGPGPADPGEPWTPGGSEVVAASDFTYLGAFQIPQSALNGSDTRVASGLAIRHVDGELRFFGGARRFEADGLTVAMDGEIWEASFPGVSAAAPYPQASFVTHWGDIYQGRRAFSNGSPVGWTNGLYFDEVDQRLYWLYGSGYESIDCEMPSMGYSTLSGSTGTAVAAWRFEGMGFKSVQYTMVPVPAAFANTHLGGKRLAVGVGGYFSVVSCGDASLGPSLTAIDPPNVAVYPDRTPLPNLPLVGYWPFRTAPPASPGGYDRAQRPGTVNQHYDQWPNDRFTWSDYVRSAVWIDTGTKRGVVFFVNLSTGESYYETSDLNGDGAETWWFVYDPTDFAAVAAGQASRDRIQPAGSWSTTYPGINYPLGGWRGGPGAEHRGAVFDPTTNRLYVMLLVGTWPASLMTVYVYQLG